MDAESEPVEAVSLEGFDEVTLNYTDEVWAPPIEEYESEIVQVENYTPHPYPLRFDYQTLEVGEISLEVGEISFAQHLLSGDALTVMAVSYTSDGEAVLGKRDPEKVSSGKGKYSFPGGFIDWEEQPYDAVEREIFEELGLDIETAPYTPLAYLKGQNKFNGKQIGSEEFAPPFILYLVELERPRDQVEEKFEQGEFSQIEFTDEIPDPAYGSGHLELDRNTQRAIQVLEAYTGDSVFKRI